MQPRWTWQRVALLGLVLLTGLGATSLAASALAPLGAGPPSLLGLRLGATPDMVRARLSSASFRTELGEDVALVADDAIADGVSPGARFEFHDGQLVAVRVELRSDHPDAHGAALIATPATVLSREVLSRAFEGDLVHARLLARTCPTHREEAERLVAAEVPRTLP